MKTKSLAFGIALFLCAMSSLIAQSGPGQLLFDPKADPLALIADTRATAVTAKKLVMIEFGADWCHDCQALAKHMSNAELKAYMDGRFMLVRIDVGRFDKNLELAKSYGIDIKKGIPAIVVIDPLTGRSLYATRNGEWSNARLLEPSDILKTLQEIKS